MIYAIVVVLVLILDQSVKYWTNVNLEVGAVKDFIPGFIHLTNERNTGAAWGIFKDGRWLFVALTIVACIVIIAALKSGYIKGKLGRWMLVLIMAGGLGNFIDRLIYGYVVDMFEFDFQIFGKNFPVFNTADIFISVCGIIFCIWLILNRNEELQAASGGPRPELHDSRGLGYDPRGAAAGKHEAQQRGTDYITQMRRPVNQTREMLEKERREAERRAQEEMYAQFENAPSQPQKTQRPSQQTARTSQTQQSRAQAGRTQQARPAQRQLGTQAAPPRTQSAQARSQAAMSQSQAQSRSQTAAPKPQTQAKQTRAPQASPPQPPKPAPAPKKSSTEFSLDDIIAEFSDK